MAVHLDGRVLVGSVGTSEGGGARLRLAPTSGRASIGRVPEPLDLRHLGHERVIGCYLLAAPEELAELAASTGWELTRVLGEGEPSYVGILERA